MRRADRTRGKPAVLRATSFQALEENDLAFLYQEQKAGGEDSTFFKLVEHDS